MADKMKPKFANFSAHNMHSLNLSAILYGTRVFGLDTSGQMYKTTFILPSTTYETNFAFIASHENAEDHQRSA